MRCSASSSRIINSPIFARARVSSRSSGSARVLSPRVPVSRNTRFHSSSSWAGIWLSRETASRGSPRSSRITTSVFRCTLHRSGSSTPPRAIDSSASAVVGFRAFFPMSASLVTMMIGQSGVQGNRVRFRGGQYGSELHNPDFMKLSEAFGLHGMRTKVSTDVGRLVGEAIAMDRPVLIEVPVGRVPRPVFFLQRKAPSKYKR